jgi:hypothetical protein
MGFAKSFAGRLQIRTSAVEEKPPLQVFLHRLVDRGNSLVVIPHPTAIAAEAGDSGIQIVSQELLEKIITAWIPLNAPCLKAALHGQSEKRDSRRRSDGI